MPQISSPLTNAPANESADLFDDVMASLLGSGIHACRCFAVLLIGDRLTAIEWRRSGFPNMVP